MVSQTFTVVDIETTGVNPENDAVVEIAAIDVVEERLTTPRSAFVKSSVPIPATASAVHHLTDLDLANALPAREAIPNVLIPGRDAIYVAHNAQFEQGFLKPYVPNVRWLCTYKASLRVFGDAPAHSNQVLRYHLNLPLERDLASPPHRAMPDAYVTAHLLCRLLREASVEDMLAWSAEPALLPTCTIGEWRGKKWSEIDEGFLQWMIKKPVDDRDLVWNAQHELKRRWAEEDTQRAEYVRWAKEMIVFATSVDDLNKWFREERESNFIKYRITENTKEYASIVAACKDHKATILNAQASPNVTAAA